MLDDNNLIKQRDLSGALLVAEQQALQCQAKLEVVNLAKTDKPVYNIILAGMGGSALAALLAKVWLKQTMPEPFEIIRNYDLPACTDGDSLFIASSYSGNTEETINCLDQAKTKGAQIAVIASGGQLIEIAKQSGYPYVQLPTGLQPRFGVIYNLVALISLMIGFNILSADKLEEIVALTDWLKAETSNWVSATTTDKNLAKQLALSAVGKTAIFYGGSLTAPVAYKWKISWNENAKNLAFWNEYPEFSHNEFVGWAAQPIEKPFAVFDIISPLEHPQITKRFELTDKLLSGLRPKSTAITLAGESLIAQMLWGSILADFVSVYLAILNNVDPTPVELVEKLKAELK